MSAAQREDVVLNAADTVQIMLANHIIFSQGLDALLSVSFSSNMLNKKQFRLFPRSSFNTAESDKQLILVTLLPCKIKKNVGY